MINNNKHILVLPIIRLYKKWCNIKNELNVNNHDNKLIFNEYKLLIEDLFKYILILTNQPIKLWSFEFNFNLFKYVIIKFGIKCTKQAYHGPSISWDFEINPYNVEQKLCLENNNKKLQAPQIVITTPLSTSVTMSRTMVAEVPPLNDTSVYYTPNVSPIRPKLNYTDSDLLNTKRTLKKVTPSSITDKLNQSTDIITQLTNKLSKRRRRLTIKSFGDYSDDREENEFDSNEFDKENVTPTEIINVKRAHALESFITSSSKSGKFNRRQTFRVPTP